MEENNTAPEEFDEEKTVLSGSAASQLPEAPQEEEPVFDEAVADSFGANAEPEIAPEITSEPEADEPAEDDSEQPTILSRVMDFLPEAEEEGAEATGGNKRRTMIITIIIVVLVLCCCCMIALAVTLYYSWDEFSPLLSEVLSGGYRLL